MQTSNAKQNFRSNDPVWVLLAESSLSDFSSEHNWRDGSTAGCLFQTLRELSMSPECMEGIAGTLAGCAKDALARTKQGRGEFLGRIRIFCQKKMIDDAKSAKPSRPYLTQQGKEQKQILPDSQANTIGGWGYFIIERGEDLPLDSSAIPPNSVDLYLYKEGG
jgi:hypothetical protein